MTANNLPVPAFEFTQGESPILVSMPHSGLHLTQEVQDGLTEQAEKLPDTDWFIPELYDFLPALGASTIKANYSRYVIDLNRPYDDKPLYSTKTTGLFPKILFEETPIFLPGKTPSSAHKALCKGAIWRAYHQAIEAELAHIKSKFGYAILFDAHSIAAEVPMLFDGVLPDFNWGTNEGHACDVTLTNAVSEAISQDYSQVINGRFKGGYITRHFGQPKEGIHAIQLELSQATYLDDNLAKRSIYQLDSAKMPKIKQQLKGVIKACLNANL